MSVVIRLKRHGRRNFPTFRFSVAYKYRPRDGRTLEQLGFYNPRHPRQAEQVSLDVERARLWLTRGALPSHTVQKLFEKHGVFEGFSLSSKKRVRTGRDVETKTRAARAARKSATLEAKAARRASRIAAKKAAAPAAEAKA